MSRFYLFLILLIIAVVAFALLCDTGELFSSAGDYGSSSFPSPY
jgi:hypothetical protein